MTNDIETLALKIEYAGKCSCYFFLNILVRMEMILIGLRGFIETQCKTPQ